MAKRLSAGSQLRLLRDVGRALPLAHCRRVAHGVAERHGHRPLRERQPQGKGHRGGAGSSEPRRVVCLQIFQLFRRLIHQSFRMAGLFSLSPALAGGIARGHQFLHVPSLGIRNRRVSRRGKGMPQRPHIFHLHRFFPATGGRPYRARRTAAALLRPPAPLRLRLGHRRSAPDALGHGEENRGGRQLRRYRQYHLR